MTKYINFCSYLTVALCLCIATVAFVQAQAPAPAFKEGDTWQFKFEMKNAITTSTDRVDGTYEIVFTQGNIKLYEVEGGRGRGGEIPIMDDVLSQALLSQVGKSEYRQPLKFPLSVGQKWSYQYTLRSVGVTGDQKRSVEVNVVGMEDVKTPAGAFKAFKLVRVEGYFPGPRATKYYRNTVTYFYSPDTKSVIKISSVSDDSPETQEGELIKFTPGS